MSFFPGNTEAETTGTLTLGTGHTFDVAIRQQVPATTGPNLAISWHPWSGYYDKPGTKNEKPNALMIRHLDLLKRINELGPGTISRIRYDVGWSAMQPKKSVLNANDWYPARITRLNEMFAERGLTGFPVIHQSPDWARPTGTDVKCLPDNPADIARFADWFARTYADYVSEIEFWNEPNLEAFAGPGRATPANYMPLLSVFSDAAKAAKPGLRIIGPNVSQVDWAWVAGCYANGLAKYVDAIGVHMYQGRQSVPPRSASTTGIDTSKPGWERARISLGLRKLYDVMTKYGDGGKAIWNTEGGWSASATGVGGDAGDYDVTAAAFIDEFLAMLADGTDELGAHPVYGLVKLSVLYQAYDPSTKDPHQMGFAILDKSGSVRPQGLSLIGHRTEQRDVRALM